MRCVIPVSYTHLDVYKRQVVIVCAIIQPCLPCSTQCVYFAVYTILFLWHQRYFLVFLLQINSVRKGDSNILTMSPPLSETNWRFWQWVPRVFLETLSTMAKNIEQSTEGNYFLGNTVQILFICCTLSLFLKRYSKNFLYLSHSVSTMQYRS